MMKRIFLLMIAIGLLSGCTATSDSPATWKKLLKKEAEEEVNLPGKALSAEQMKQLVDQAFKTTQSSAVKSFWYKGYIANNLSDNRTTSMYEGVVVRPSSYLVNARLAGTPFKYYHANGHTYVFNGQMWKEIKNSNLSYDPLKGLNDWTPFFGQFKQLPDEDLLSIPCTKVQVYMKGNEWIKNSSSPYFTPLRQLVAEQPHMQTIYDQTIVKMTLWIGKETHLVYQYQTWIRMPIPSIGYMDQEVKFQFIKYNDAGIKLKSPEEMARYVKNPEPSSEE